MKLVVHLSDFGWPVPTDQLAPLLADVATLTESAGFDGLAVADHLWQHPIMGGPERACLEAYTTLAFLAAHTRDVRLLTLATGAHFRHPGVLAKTVTTLDVLSGGRAWLGIGAAWNEHEHLGLGVPFPPVAERFVQLEETIRICLQMWSADNGPFEGSRYHLAETLNSPQALSEPHPPILIGGGGERKTLRLVARYADACNVFGSPDEIQARVNEFVSGGITQPTTTLPQRRGRPASHFPMRQTSGPQSSAAPDPSNSSWGKRTPFAVSPRTTPGQLCPA